MSPLPFAVPQSAVPQQHPQPNVPPAPSASPAAAPGDATTPYHDMMVRLLGPVVVRAFRDDDVTEVYVNPADWVVRLDTRSRGRVDTGHRLDPKRVEMFLNCVAARAGTTLDAEQPRLQAELPSETFRGSRVQGFIPPLAAGPCFTIRKPPSVVYSLDDFIRQGVLTPAHRDVLGEAVVGRENVLVVGGTNSGKSTFCNGLIKEITDRCPTERLVLLEDTVELQCAAPDHLALRTAPGISLAQLVKSTMRASPNRIVVGEVRDEAALDLLDAWATGHPGGCATLHASSAEGALLRLDRLARRANVPSQVDLIAEAVDLVVVMTGGNSPTRRRRVIDLVRVAGLASDGRFLLHRCTETGTWTPIGPTA